ncbi:MAG TPA: ATP-binding protein [Methylomirabilota bacterium]|jgi:PAS domain S-box-containing protein|nr:ATP-binding protein [Methylomirabilota bacterium]
MVKEKQRVLFNYGLAVVSVALVAGVSARFPSVLVPLPAVPYLAAVAVSARVGGLGAGLCALVLSTLSLKYVSLPPAASTADLVGAAQLSVFVLVALLLTLLSDQRRKMEKALREREAQQRLLVMQNADGVLVVDERGEVLLTNPAAEAILGRSSEELLGSTFGFPLVVGKPAELDIPHRSEEGRVAETRIVEMRVARIQWRGKSVFLASLRDVTERKRLEEALHTMNVELERHVQVRTAELQRVNDDLKQLVYVSAHDLQEPVRMVALYTQLLERRLHGRLDAQTNEYLGYLREGATRMAQQLNDLMRYTEIEVLPQRRTAVDCCALLLRVLRAPEMQAALQETRATMTHDSLPTVMADEQQIELVLTHLLQNALTFRGVQPPQIHVSCSPRDQQWVFAVRDNGIGIDPQYAEQIFRLFERLHSRQRYPGTGMGLPICKKVIERHNGRIWVESELGKGATFFFTLPREETSTA